MLCSKCSKNPAIIFIDKVENGNTSLEGLCYDCAIKQGINPLETLARQQEILAKDEVNIEEFKDQFSKIINDISENMNLEGLDLEDLNEMDFNNIDLDNLDAINNIKGFNISLNHKKGEESSNENDDEEKQDGTNPIGAFAIPIGSIFSNIMNGKPNGGEENSTNERKKHRIEKKKNTKTSSKKKFLDSFGTNLTNKAKNNELDAVIGRDREIQRIVQILNRRSKNNPCLIGEPGVGKTAIAQGLAIKIAQNNVPAKLLNKEVYLLDMTSMIAGTQFRGQFESRMKGVIEECKEYGNIILVIDEVHNIIGAGDGEHAMNAANILKPALSNGEIQLIGTTTLKEYRKYIEKDTALERRFQQVLIEEPNIDDAIGILEGIKSYYEEYHKVKISSDIIRQTVIMSEKYIHDRFLPDKAIDILDEACSRKNLENKDLFKLEILSNELKAVQEEKESIPEAKNPEEENENFQKVADLKTKECQLTEQIEEIKKNMKPMNLGMQDIAGVIESWTKIPVSKITEEETQRLLNLEENLHKKIIGQEQAVNAVSRAIRRNRAGLKSTKRPPSFIFVGPTGVGKTELAKSLAYEMFGSRDNIIRIDMSEYMESHSTAKLIGAPPGYVGYDDAGQLTEKVKRKPYSIILLDEIEKAHPDVFNILLQVLDDGRLTDSQGNIVNFENTIIIMTSNAGSNLNTNSIGFAKQTVDKTKIEDRLKEVFRPEFLNRIDEIVLFDSLTTEQLLKIVDLMLNDTISVLKDKNIELEISKDAKEFILEKGTNLKFGARPLRRAIQRYVEDELSEFILRGKLVDGQKVVINYENGQDVLKFDIQ